MHAFPIDAYAYHNRLRGAHPGEKMLFAGATIGLCLLSGSPVVAGLALAAVTVALVRGAGIPPAAFWYFLRIPAGFVLVGVATMAVVAVPPDGAEALLAVPVGPWRIGVTAGGLGQAGKVLAVSMASVGSTLFLALTTPLVDVTDQLRRWRVPALLVELMVLVYRFIFVLLDTAQAMYVAQDARLGYSNWRRSLRSLAMLASLLYLRAQARATALFTALSARGYTGELHVLAARPAWSPKHLLLIAAVEGLLLATAVGVRLGGNG